MMDEIPEKQSAWIVVTKGIPSKALQLKQDTPVPKELTQGEVLVRVDAAALNPVYVYSSIFIQLWHLECVSRS